MKLSKYNYSVIYDDKKILYNTLSRKYLVYNNSQSECVEGLLGDLNRKRYTLQEANLIKNLYKKDMVIDDDFDQVELIRFKESVSKFENNQFLITLQPTLDCNFRCTYCYEKHRHINMDEDMIDRIVKFVERITPKLKLLKIAWFGGEPMLEFDRMVKLTKKFKEICNENNCEYQAFLTSNGYLFNDQRIKMLKELNIHKVQVTVDGYKEDHDKKRPLANGKGTYDKIEENCLKMLENGIKINLRINVDEKNCKSITKLFDLIPQQYRDNVSIHIVNVFQNKKTINLFELYKLVIQKGYSYYNTQNKYVRCEAAQKNAVVIQPDGKITPCSIMGEEGKFIGHINTDGKMILNNTAEYYKFQNFTVLDIEECRKCIQLPMCMGGCKNAKYSNNDICNGENSDGLSLKERIILQYLNDIKFNKIVEEDII